MVFLVLGGLGCSSLHAQDRGAPRFGPTGTADSVEAEATDAGRLWSVAAPPFDRLERRYGVKADSAWATHLRRGVLRLPHCTAALVSANGLAVTTAECVRRHLEEEGEAAVVAEQRADERSVPGLHADRLVSATDVTAQVQAARRDTSVQRAVASVQQQLQSAAGPTRQVEVRAVAGGAQYTAYTYRRYDDVRLAFLPESKVSAFGGLDAAMTYPRQALDAALIRVYASDAPLSVEHFFDTATRGLRPGDAVLSVGRSRATRRAESADQLAVRRDLVLPNQQALLDAWIRAVSDPTARSAPPRGRLAEAQMGRKRTQLRLEALRDTYVMTRLRRGDAHLRTALRQDSTLQRRYGGVLDSLAAIQAAKRNLGPEYQAFSAYGLETYGSVTFRRLVRALKGDEGGGGTMTESSSRVADRSVRSTPTETALLTVRLRRLQSALPLDSTAARRLFGGQSPAERAASIAENSVLAAPDYAPRDGQVVPPDDPAAPLVEVLGPRVRSFEEAWTRLVRAERQLTQQLARARQAVQTVPTRPAQEGVLRLTDGRLLGYPDNGTLAPPITTFYGLYGQAHALEGAPWTLPERWREAASELNRSTPITLVASTDPAASTEGAPLLNKYLELVGVAAGTNVQGVAGEYLFLPERMRTVGVDLRGLRQSLRTVYQAERVADELFGDTSSPAESPQ